MMDTIQELYSTYDNPIVIGDFNAHTGDTQERAAGGAHIPERVVENRRTDMRGYLLLDLLDTTGAIMTNGRKDGSRHQPSQLYTYVNKALHTESLIDYILLSEELYGHVTSQHNTTLHNTTIKTDHALIYITIKDHRKPICRGGQRQRKLARKRRRSVPPAVKVVFEKYQLQMDEGIRTTYAQASNHKLANWITCQLPKLARRARTDPQTAVDEAASGVAAAILEVASATLPTRAVKPVDTSKSYPSKPRFWNKHTEPPVQG
jgi:hypothetical protein